MAGILAGAEASPPDAPEWAPATGPVAIGMDVIGTVATGTAIGIIIMVIMSSLSVISAFRFGGVGAQAGVIPTDMAMVIHMDMATVTATRTATEVTDTVTTVTAMAMDMGTTTATTDMATADMALPLGRE